MSETEWPYSLPIWRRAHEATSPDGRLVARIDAAHEVSMGNPTSGVLRISNGIHVQWCNPSFLWSDNSQFLAVPQYFHVFGLLRRQRLLVIAFETHQVYASKASAWYYQPESFAGGLLVATVNPVREKRAVEFQIPDGLPKLFFRHVPHFGHGVPRVER